MKIEDEILFGGARGGGKTDAGMVWIVEPVEHPKYRGLVIRRNSDDLNDWIARAKVLYANLGGEYAQREFRFPSGAVIVCGHLADENAYERYQGHEYQRMLIEELTHIPSERLYLKLLGSNRSTVPELRPQLFATTNPGGPGHRWVKARFIDPMIMKKRVYITLDGKQRSFRASERYVDTLPSGQTLTRVFVQSLVDDNPFIVKYDPRYIAYLDSLPADLRAMWRFGEWESGEVEGAYYSQQLAQVRREKRIALVPHDPTIEVETYWDIGVGDSTAIGFVQKTGLEFRFIDYYANEGEGIPHYAKILKEKAKDLGYNYSKHYAPHDIAVKEFGSGATRIETAKKLGIRFQIVERQKFEDGIEAARDIFPFCMFDRVMTEAFVDGLTNYRKKYNQRLGQFTNEPEHDWASHPADMFRYFALVNRGKHTSTSLKVRIRKEQLEREEMQSEREGFNPYKIFQ